LLKPLKVNLPGFISIAYNKISQINIRSQVYFFKIFLDIQVNMSIFIAGTGGCFESLPGLTTAIGMEVQPSRLEMCIKISLVPGGKR